MTRLLLVSGILIILAVILSGCTGFPATNGTLQPSVTPSLPGAPPTNASMNAALNTSTIPLILTDDQWKMANDCGWTADNISETAALFADNCRVRQLESDGWIIEGIGYDMNVLGSRCRISTHRDAPENCDWCLDAGPTLSLRYKGVMTTEFMVHMKEKTVSGYSLSLPENSWSSSDGVTDSVVFRNGTVFYTFRKC